MRGKFFPQMEKSLTKWMDSLIGDGKPFRNESAWARKANVPVSTFNAIRSRGGGKTENLIKIAKAAGANPLDILRLAGEIGADGEDEEVAYPPGPLTPEQVLAVRVREAVAQYLPAAPVLIPIEDQRVSAGGGADILDYFPVDQQFATNKNLRALKVYGNSMEPLINDGDVILVDVSASCRPGDVVLATFSQSLIVKRLVHHDGRDWLVGNNGEMDASRVRLEGRVLKMSRDL